MGTVVNRYRERVRERAKEGEIGRRERYRKDRLTSQLEVGI
jgi:hypothetical protein